MTLLTDAMGISPNYGGVIMAPVPAVLDGAFIGRATASQSAMADGCRQLRPCTPVVSDLSQPPTAPPAKPSDCKVL